jgi:hypothetical protein
MIKYILPWIVVKLTTLVATGTDFIDRSQSNYDTTMTKKAPNRFGVDIEIL